MASGPGKGADIYQNIVPPRLLLKLLRLKELEAQQIAQLKETEVQTRLYMTTAPEPIREEDFLRLRMGLTAVRGLSEEKNSLLSSILSEIQPSNKK